MKILFVGGGTAGHVNPAIAIAEELRGRDKKNEILFIGREGGPENELITKSGFNYKTIKIKGIKRSLSIENIKRIRDAFNARAMAKKIISEFSPDVIVGTGGYVCWPVISAGKRRGIKAVIHESNVVPGLTTRLLQNFCDVIFLNFRETEKYIKRKKNIYVVGNPIRRGFENLSREDARRRLGLHKNDIQILSFGGSIGAERLNSISIELMRVYSSKNKSIHHTHATGRRFYKKNDESTREIQSERCTVLPYIDNMPIVMRGADIVISRCGAITLSEIAMSGVAAILIPSPNVTNNHQLKNAKHLADKGHAILIEEKDVTVERLRETVDYLIQNEAKRKEMALGVREYFVPDSEKKIADKITELAKLGRY